MKILIYSLNSINNPKQTLKQFLTLLAAILLLAGCKKTEGVSKVSVHVNDFVITQEEIRGTECHARPHSVEVACCFNGRQN